MSTAQQEHLKIEQLQHASADELEVMAGRERENLEGWVPQLANDAEVREALEKAFDYRGDITITRRDGTVVEGYLYDRRDGKTLGGLCREDHPDAEGRCADGALDGCVQRHRSAEVQRARYRGGQKLRGLGEEVLGEESRGRKEYRHRGGEARLICL